MFQILRRPSELKLLLKMNILYFDDSELWSPKIDEMLEELEDTELKTVSKV
jgi:hypothetical protein